MVDAGLWVPITPVHFRHAATPLTFEMQVRARSEWLGRAAALFGTSALYWLGVEVAEPAVAEFLVPRARRSMAVVPGVRSTSRWDERDVIRHRGVRTSTAARAIIDMAIDERRATNVENAIDSSIRLRRTALSQIQSRLSRLSGQGRHGCPLLRELLLDSGGESKLERRFLRLVRLAGFTRPRCQVVVSPRSGRTIRVDFLFEQVVVEVSGRLGHTSDRERQKDARRRNELQERGFKVIEFTTADVIDDPDYVVEQLKSLFRSHLYRGKSRSATDRNGSG
jgi:very-short-patch-repair endonuclease